MSPALRFPVVEIFESMQGEGYNTGKPVVFVRFGGCNLACPWCDTEYDEFTTMDAEALVGCVLQHEPRALVLTGGEPLLQADLGWLLERFKEQGCWIAVETNGLLRPPPDWLRRIDYLAVSPKALYARQYDDAAMLRRADEVRIVVDGDVRDFCEDLRRRIEADHYFLSPCDRGGAFNVEETIRLLGQLNEGRREGKWLLSLQTHKLAGVR